MHRKIVMKIRCLFKEYPEILRLELTTNVVDKELMFEDILIISRFSRTSCVVVYLIKKTLKQCGYKLSGVTRF